jgi:hypothetical protein
VRAVLVVLAGVPADQVADLLATHRSPSPTVRGGPGPFCQGRTRSVPALSASTRSLATCRPARPSRRLSKVDDSKVAAVTVTGWPSNVPPARRRRFDLILISVFNGSLFRLGGKGLPEMRVILVVIASAIVMLACSRTQSTASPSATDGTSSPSAGDNLASRTGCTKDTDCKGDRICESGRCVTPTMATVPASTTAPEAAPSAARGVDQFADPFAYCAAVDTTDEVDARYVGPKEPPAIR